MKYKQNMLDLLEEIKDSVLAFETIEDIEEIKDKMNEILNSALYRIERRSED